VELRVIPKQVDEQPVVEFSVLDSGAGLAPEVMERLYEAFFSTKVEGMGIGLNLCRTIVESHQGGCRPRTSTMAPKSPVAVSPSGFRLRRYKYIASKDAGSDQYELDSQEGHRLRRRRRRGRARFAAMAARRQGLPRPLLRLR
jgi:hypothetical protein